jgi:hypothetical protein
MIIFLSYGAAWQGVQSVLLDTLRHGVPGYVG